jgi:hypothetical protein
MDALVDVIQNHIEYAPAIIFGVLLLAGLNIPVSEDGMLFNCDFPGDQESAVDKHQDYAPRYATLTLIFGGASHSESAPLCS